MFLYAEGFSFLAAIITIPAVAPPDMLDSLPRVPADTIPTLSTEQMREVDRLMIAEYGITLTQMMENAGRNLADLVQMSLDRAWPDSPILVLAGRGNNGGGGLVAARHLANRGADVQVITATDLEAFHGLPAQQLGTLMNMGIPVTPGGDGWELPSADLVVDALIGYGLQGAPQGEVADLIQLVNSHPAPVISLDVPSGLASSSGQVYQPCVRATATLTLALPKTGLLAPEREVVGNLYLADISVPPALYAELGIDIAPLFTRSRIIRLVTH